MTTDAPTSRSVLAAIAEQLKFPLTNIARRAEVLQSGSDAVMITNQAMAAMQLVDSYLLGLHMMETQMQLELEPVSVSSLLVETAHSLARYAQDYRVDLDINLAGKYEPVMAHRAGLQAALLSMGYALIQAQAETSQGKRGRLTLASHRNAQGIVAGLYGDYEQLQATDWRQALKLCGHAQQPLSNITAGSGAGVFVADAILQAMNTRLKVGRHLKQSGLAAVLLPSRQLQLV